MVIAAPSKPTTTAQLRPMTIEDYYALPEDGPRFELILGEFLEMPSPSSLHQVILISLSSQLYAFVRTHRLGVVMAAPMDVKFTGIAVLEPDLLFVRADRRRIIERNIVAEAPDLVMEVLSPNTARRDLVTKAAIYASHGVQEYWVIDPEAQTVVVRTLIGDRLVPTANVEGEARSLVLPGFAVAVAELFADPLIDPADPADSTDQAEPPHAK